MSFVFLFISLELQAIIYNRSAILPTSGIHLYWKKGIRYRTKARVHKRHRLQVHSTHQYPDTVCIAVGQ